MNKLKLESIITAVVIYLILIVIVFYAAFYTSPMPKAKNYTEKKSEIIEVSLGSPNSHTKIVKKSKKKSQKKHKKRKKIVKKVRNAKKEIKKATKIKKSKKAKKVVKKSQKPKAASLFKNLPKSIKDDTPDSSKQKGASGKSHKKVNRSSGVENAYFAKIQNTLKGWPAQSNFAGEKIRVKLTVYPTGLFEYKILYRSLNPEFNRSLKAYLEQLKKFGFGPHSNPKPYQIVVEFIAKD